MLISRKDLRHLQIFTTANLKSRYRNTFYGFIWVLLNPILTFLAQVFAFTTLFQIKFPNYAVYLFSGLFPWIFIVQSIEMATGAFIYNFPILKNFPVNPLVLVIMQVIDNFINFVCAYTIMTLYFIITNKVVPSSIIYCFLPLCSLFIAVSSMSVVFALTNTRYRDTKFVISFVFSLLFYLTPIFYSIAIVKEEHRQYLEINPVYILLKPIQQAFMSFPPEIIWHSTLKSLMISSVFLIVAVVSWKKYKNMVIMYA